MLVMCFHAPRKNNSERNRHWSIKSISFRSCGVVSYQLNCWLSCREPQGRLEVLTKCFFLFYKGSGCFFPLSYGLPEERRQSTENTAVSYKGEELLRPKPCNFLKWLPGFCRRLFSYSTVHSWWVWTAKTTNSTLGSKLMSKFHRK